MYSHPGGLDRQNKIFLLYDQNTYYPRNRSACPLPAFISLLDNYESDTGEPEIVTPEEEAENHKFLDCMLRTPTMKVPVKTYGGVVDKKKTVFI